MLSDDEDGSSDRGRGDEEDMMEGKPHHLQVGA